MHRVLHWVEVLALAGRDRGRRRDAAGARRLGAEGAYLLSAYGQQGGLVLGEVAVSDATNEPGVVAALLAGPPPAGETVTFEALFTRWAVAE